MAIDEGATTVSLTAAAARMRVPYKVALDRVLRGDLSGWQDDGRHWRVDRADLERLLSEGHQVATP